MFKKVLSLFVLLLVFSMAAQADMLIITYSNGVKQMVTLKQPVKNLKGIEMSDEANDTLLKLWPTVKYTSDGGGKEGEEEAPSVPPAGIAPVTPPPPPPPAGNTPPSSQGFSGKWSTKWGALTFFNEGGVIKGNYTYGNGRLEGQLSPDGKTLEGTWAEAPTYAAPNYSGKFKFTLSPDGNRLDGQWWYGDGRNGGEWNGVRTN